MSEMTKCIIFFGNVVHTADDQFNEWSAAHPNMDILEVQYQQTSSNEHSICVFYNVEE